MLRLSERSESSEGFSLGAGPGLRIIVVYFRGGMPGMVCLPCRHRRNVAEDAPAEVAETCSEAYLAQKHRVLRTHSRRDAVQHVNM